MLINCPLRNLKLLSIVLVREMSRRIVERSFAKCSYHTFKKKTCSFACDTCKTRNKLCKFVSASFALIIIHAIPISAHSLWSFSFCSLKLLCKNCNLLCLIFIFRVVGCHLFEFSHIIAESRHRINIHGNRSFSQEVVNLIVELVDELHLLSLIL
jgi:hypothetical protein